MKNLAVICPSQTDATSFYRAVGPLAELRRERSDLALTFINSIDWATLKLCDAVFLQRPFSNNHLMIAELTKRNRLPLWLDFDDDLFCVPAWNPCAAIYNKPEIQKNVATMAALADVITVSTEAIRVKLLPLNKNIVVVPNAFDARLVGDRLARASDRQGPLIMWRGSKTHRKDLNVAGESCIQLAQANPNSTWLFLGETPWFADFMPHKQTICAEPIDPIEYWEFLGKTQPTIMIVPLDDCEFNRGKSNICWQEASFAGAATLAPNWTEWQKPGVTNYKSDSDFLPALASMFDASKDQLIVNAEKSWQYINNNLLLSIVNKKRHAILEELCP
jgi:hypothetical protein